MSRNTTPGRLKDFLFYTVDALTADHPEDVAIAEITRLREALEEEKIKSVKALEALAHLMGTTCWCEMDIGNPMVKEHSLGCQLARAAIKPKT